MSKPLKTSIHQIGAPYIEQMLGANKGKLYDLSRDIMSIGRAPDNDIIFVSESVSRCHAFLKRTPNGWLLQDNQSKNGIKKNGEKVTESQLRSGDVVQIGDFVFKFVEPEQSTGEPTASRPRVSRRDAATGQRAAGGITPAPSIDEALQALRAKAQWSSVQFGAGIAFVVVISVLIGFKLRSVFNHHDVSDTNKSTLSAPAAVAGESTAPVGAAKTGTARPKTEAAKPIAESTAPAEPIDQNNPNEGRVVAEEILAPNYAAKPAESATVAGRSVFDGPPPGPALVETPPPPPIPLNDGLSKKDLQIQNKKPGTRNVTRDLGVYLQEGRDYLKEGDFESAALAFRFALVIEPNNRTAIEGIRAAEFRRKELPAPASSPAPATSAPATPLADTRDIPLPPGDRKQQVRMLLKTALGALTRRSYQEAINNAERVRRIEIRGETAYLNEAKQIIDRAKQKQKEDFDPFIARAKEKLRAGDYAGSKMLCEEMLRTDPAYTEARECVTLATEGLKGKK